MISIQYIEPELMLSLHKKVIFVNPNDLQIFKEVEIPFECKINGSIEHTTRNEIEESDRILKPEPTIQHAKLSSNHRFLAVSTAGQKALLLYECRPENAKLISTRQLARTSSALTFSSDSKILLVTDKTGDCYLYDCEKPHTIPKLIFGHLSIVYDIIFTTDMKYIITCDRDDKIRVTNYPNCYEIHSYCLGHKEFVSGIHELGGLESDKIVSVSGDKTLCLWNFLDGTKLAEHELPAPGIKMCLRQIDAQSWLVAVLLHQPNESIFVLEIKKECNKFEILKYTTHSFDTMIVTNFCNVNERLFITGMKNEHLDLVVFGDDTPNGWVDMIRDQFKECSIKLENVSNWFKKKYDNVTDYLERKKRRIEEKKCK